MEGERHSSHNDCDWRPPETCSSCLLKTLTRGSWEDFREVPWWVCWLSPPPCCPFPQGDLKKKILNLTRDHPYGGGNGPMRSKSRGVSKNFRFRTSPWHVWVQRAESKPPLWVVSGLGAGGHACFSSSSSFQACNRSSL